MLLSADVPDRELLSDAFSERAGHRVRIEAPERGDKRRPIDHALANAREALARRLAESGAQLQLLEGVAQVFGPKFIVSNTSETGCWMWENT